MKKGLSILLIAAALFGFYGGSVSINDVLASKDYWEKEGERTTADMNKLEDGLNQLKDNEQAYLDGQVALEDGKVALVEGEKTLAEGEKTLAKGEVDYANGQKELAKGEADYAAAPGKLADAEKKLAAGKAALNEGEDSLKSLATLIDGINQVLDGYPAFSSGYEKLRSGRISNVKQAQADAKDPSSDTNKLVSVLQAYASAGDSKAKTAAGSFAKASEYMSKQNPSSFTNEQYDGFNSYLENSYKALGQTNTFFNGLKGDLSKIAAKYASELQTFLKASAKYSEIAGKGIDASDEFEAAGKEREAAKKAKDENTDPDKQDALNAAYYKAVAKYAKKATAALQAREAFDLAAEEFQKELDKAQALVTENPDEVKMIKTAYAVFIQGDGSDAANVQKYQVLSTALDKLGEGFQLSDYSYIEDLHERRAEIQLHLKERPDEGGGYGYGFCIGAPATALEAICDGITETQSKLKPKMTAANEGIKGYAQITSKDTTSKLKTLSGGVAQIIGGVLGSGNKELISGMNKAASAVGFKPGDFTPVSKSKLTKDLSSGSKLESFYQDMNKVEKAFKSVLPALKAKGVDGKKTLKEGYKTYYSGLKQYKQGLADYAAAPAKLADGRAKLAAGLKKLMDGRKALQEGRIQLADGRVQLEEGAAKLAEYEDGEQQVRDGLATLMGTAPQGGLVSILERRNGDDDFDNGDTHLDLNEGLDAVTVGRGYQADSGVLITKELTSRAVGTGAAIAGGVLALLAALLSFLKKNKASAVFAALSAAAAGFGVAYGMNAGSEFSDIAGSTVGNLPWIAGGVLAAVAVVHAIVHFAAPKAAPKEA